MEETGRPVPVTLRFRAIRVERPGIGRLVRHCLESEEAPAGGLGVVLGGSRFLRRLNREWRGLDRTTDVLSFSLGEGPPLPPAAAALEPVLLGEIAISVPRCFEQARDRGVDPGVELVRLLVHGVLHVLGHDHQEPAQRKEMLPRERRLAAWAARQGIGPGLLRPAPPASVGAKRIPSGRRGK